MPRILVVDDDPDILKLADKVLTAAEHEVFLACDAIKAMEFLDKSDFDALISDANMPHFSGFDLIKTLRNQKKHTGMAIAMLTGRREKKDIQLAMSMGVDDYIVKPLDPLIFLKKVEALFEKKPANSRPEMKFPTASAEADASVTMTIKLVHLSELGVKICTPFEMPKDAIIELDSHIFQKIGAVPPPMKVFSSTQVNNKQWESRALFLGANEAFLQKVRAYVLFPGSHINSITKKAS